MPKTLTRADLADIVSEKIDLNGREAKDLVEAFFDKISSTLERGEHIKVFSFSLKATGQA